MVTQINMQYTCWQNYFTCRLDSRSVKCNICDANDIVMCCSREYAPVHLYRTHNMINEEIIFQWNSDNDIIWQYFSKEDLFTAKCKFCRQLLNGAYKKKNLERHLKSVHSQEIAAMQEEITRTWVSPHFTFDLDNCDIKCIHCNYSGKMYYGVDVLKNHLNNSHHIIEGIGETENYNVDATTQQSITEGNNVATSSQDHNIGVNRSEIQDPQR